MKLFLRRNLVIAFSFAALFLGCSKEIEQTASKNFTLDQIGSGVAPVYNAPATGRPIKDQYIVVFNDDVSDVDQVTEALSKQGGFKPKFTYKHAIKGFAASIPAQALEGISRNPNVKYIEQDQEVKLEAITQSNATWGIDRIDQTSLPLSKTYTYASNGSTVDAYIFDTGIRYDHVEFGGRAFKLFDAITSGGDGVDRNGHGTHVAGTVGGITFGVAKSINLYGVKVLSDAGSGSYSGIIAGINSAMDHHTTRPAVGNMSLGGGASSTLDAAVRNAIADGIVMCVAAGNDNLDASNFSPARTIEAITVGSTTSTDAKSSFSNYGSIVDIHAPGSSILSAYYLSSSSTATLSGTSMASPHVAGAAALYLEEFPGSTPAAVQTGLKSRAAVGKITGLPTGTVNALLQTIAPAPPTVPPAIPTLNSPAAGATNVATNPTFSWSAASNAQSYTLEVSTSSTFSSSVQIFNTTSTSQAVSGLLQGTPYYWRVKANNVVGSSAYTSSRTFTTTLSAPTLTSPANGATGVPRLATLTWNAIQGVESYEIQISTSSKFTGAATVSSASATYTVPSQLNSRTTYYWRVRSKKGTLISSYSASRRFTTAR